MIDTEVNIKDLHITLTYKKPVEAEMVKNDIYTYLRKIRKNIQNDYEYCYIVKTIIEKRPAIHILLRGDIQIQSELLKHWDKGPSKIEHVTHADRRAMDYYLTKWGGKVYRSKGFI